MLEVDEFVFFTGLKVFWNFIDNKTDHIAFIALVFSIEPVIEFMDVLVDVILGFLLVFILTGDLSPGLLIMIDRLWNPLAELTYFHIKVKVDIEYFDQPFNSRFRALQFDYHPSVSLNNMQRDILPKFHIDLLDIEIIQTDIN